MPNDHRIVVIGTSSAGKSTFARELATAIDAPWIELDDLHWGPDWTPKPAEEFHRLIQDAASREAWVADGNYAPVRHILWPRATLIVWLNYRFPLVFWRGLKRSVRRALSGEELWHGNRESLTTTFGSRDSILLWIWSTHGLRQKEFRDLRRAGEFPNLCWIEFTHPSQARQWLAEVGTQDGASRRTLESQSETEP